MKTLFTFLTVMLFSAIAYAQQASLPMASSSRLSNSSEVQRNFYGKNFQQCEDELQALGRLDQPSYQSNRALLEENVGRATRYLLLRPTLSPDIQNVMDSVHQANIAKNCQQIRQKLYGALLREAESPTR